MIELIKQYWQQYLCGTPAHPTGLVITLWLTVASLGLGFVLAVPLAVAKVSANRWLSIPVSLYTYVIRGTPLYVQLLLLYSGVYSLDAVRSTPFLSWLLPGRLQLYDPGFHLEHRRLHDGNFCRRDQSDASRRNRSSPRLRNVRSDSLPVYHPAVVLEAGVTGLQQRSHPDAPCDDAGSDCDSA